MMNTQNACLLTACTALQPVPPILLATSSKPMDKRLITITAASSAAGFASVVAAAVLVYRLCRPARPPGQGTADKGADESGKEEPSPLAFSPLMWGAAGRPPAIPEVDESQL